jgi:hypothetical protein
MDWLVQLLDAWITTADRGWTEIDGGNIGDIISMMTPGELVTFEDNATTDPEFWITLQALADRLRP